MLKKVNTVLTSKIAPSAPRVTPAKKPLSPKWRDMLVTGDHAYHSRSEAVMAITLAMVNSGWDWSDYYGTMSDPHSHALADWFHSRKIGRTRSPQDVLRRMKRTWERAVAKVQSSPAIENAQDARQEIGLIRAALREVVFTGRSGIVDRLVLECLHKEATKRGSIVVFLSTRSIALETGVSRTTVSRAVRRLVAGDWIRVEGREQADHAMTYRLKVPRRRRDTPSQRGTGREDCVPVVPSAIDHAGQDLFLRLGRYAAAVYAALENPGRAQEIALMTGMCRRSASKHLKVMADLGLVESVGGVWRRTEREADDASGDVGATGLRKRRADRFTWERKAWSLVVSGVMFAWDLRRYGKRTAIENARRRQVPSGVDPATGEILELAA